jgi:hypothetical protein
MCASPMSASDWHEDPVNCLWRISRLPGAESFDQPQDRPVDQDVLTQDALHAVAWHLCARGHLVREGYYAAREAASASLAAWHKVAREIAETNPRPVSRAHAFHARLASHHQAAYRALARKQLSDLAACARLKTEGLLAAVTAAEGDLHAAGDELDGISLAWRAGLPVRLPGLRAIELAAAAWYSASGDAGRAREAAARAATVTGVFSAYPEDAPADWPKRPSQQELLRFAFAATRLPEAIESWSIVQEA